MLLHFLQWQPLLPFHTHIGRPDSWNCCLSQHTGTLLSILHILSQGQKRDQNYRVWTHTSGCTNTIMRSLREQAPVGGNDILIVLASSLGYPSEREKTEADVSQGFLKHNILKHNTPHDHTSPATTLTYCNPHTEAAAISPSHLICDLL